MTRQQAAILQMIICAALWSIAGVLIKFIDCNPFVIAGFRSLISAFTVFIFMKVIKMKFIFNKKVLLTAVFMCLTFLAFVTANKLTTSANAIVLQFTAPVFVLIISAVVLKQKLNKSDVLVTAITLLGIALFFVDEIDSGKALGNVVGVLSGLFMGTMFICVGTVNMQEKMNGTLLAHIFTAIVGIPFIFLTENTLNLTAVSNLLLLGVVQLGIPYILLCYASLELKPITVSLLSVLEPLLNPVWVAIFYKEVPGVISLIGAVIIIVTITIWCVRNDIKVDKDLKGV